VSNKWVQLGAVAAITTALAVAGASWWRSRPDQPSEQDGFRHLMERKIKGSQGDFDGFTSDPATRRRSR